MNLTDLPANLVPLLGGGVLLLSSRWCCGGAWWPPSTRWRCRACCWPWWRSAMPGHGRRPPSRWSPCC
ncbi:hypothetical protein ACFQU7_00280 [Pseudoroseomonas wenyumeiae]